MRKTLFITAIILALSIPLVGSARAQETAPPNPRPAPAATAAQTLAAKPQQTLTKKLAPVPAPNTQEPLTLDTQEDKESYAIGMSFGSSLRSQSVDVDLNILMRGLKDSLGGGKTLLTDEEERAVLTALRAGIQKRKEEKMAQAGDANFKEAGIRRAGSAAVWHTGELYALAWIDES